MEHRWGERFSLDVSVRLTARPFAVRNGRLTNVSVSGAFIRTGLDLRPLTRIQIVLEAARGRHPTPLIAAYVTRILPEGVGVEWCEFAPKAILDLIRAQPKATRSARGRSAERLENAAGGAAGSASEPSPADVSAPAAAVTRPSPRKVLFRRT
jgi:hypothetical protein